MVFVRERNARDYGPARPRRHSWGSILGVFMAKARPDLFSAFVATGQVVDPWANLF